MRRAALNHSAITLAGDVEFKLLIQGRLVGFALKIDGSEIGFLIF